MINLKIRTLLLVITLLSPTVFTCARQFLDFENKSIVLIDLNEEEEEDQRPEEVKEVDVSEEYVYSLMHIKLAKLSALNTEFIDQYAQNVDLSIVSPPPEYS